MMNLSEAIRLGSLLNPQGFGAYSQRSRKYLGGLVGPLVETTCAMGAACRAVGLSTDPEKFFYPYPAEWHPVVLAFHNCPAEGCNRRGPGEGIVTHLNDEHKWTREQIADFVAGVERRHVVETEMRRVCV